MSNKWYNHSYENSGSDNNVIYNSSFDTTFDYNHTLFLSKSLILPVNIRDVKVPCSMSRTLSSLCRCMINLPRLQILALSNVGYVGYVEGISSTGQPYCSLTALQKSCSIKLEPISRRGSSVSHTDDPFSATGSSTSLNFGGALTLVSLSFPGLLRLITLCADY